VRLLERMPGYRVERFFLTDDRNPAQALTRARRSRRAARGADLVHLHGEAAAILCAGLLRSRPGVFNFHGLHLSRRSRGLRLAAVTRLLRRATAASRGAICSSTSERDEAAGLVGPELEPRLVLIESGIELPPPADRERRRRTREELGVAAGEIAVIFAAQLEPRKGPLDFLAGLELARSRGAPLAGLVLGEGPLADEVRGRAPAAGAAVLGHRDDFDLLLEASDVFVLPSEREGLSLALIGAMAAGLAVAVADGPGNPETVADAGEIFPFGDSEALAALLAALAADPERRERLGRAARERAAERYSAERMVEEMRALYDRAAGGVSAPDLAARP
jgi:glycosyltransferase involved in cell wall biosynthesis